MNTKLALVASQPTTRQLLRDAFTAQDEARRAAAEAEAIVTRLVRTLAAERGLTFMRVEAARREVMGG